MRRVRLFLPLALILAATVVLAACGQAIDDAFPPGDPVIEQPGDNPVLGSEGPGIAEASETNYVLLGGVALGLILAGMALVKAGRWLDADAAD